MLWNRIYKIKNSIDVYLVDEEYVLFYFMNTRARKRFRVNETVIKLIEEIDGERTAEELYNDFSKNHTISREEFEHFFDKMIDAKVIIEKLENHVLDDADINRYDRQISYFSEFLESELEAEKAQLKLKESSIGIIGCGAVGGDIAIQLAMAGVESFVLMDYDTVEEGDCARHMYYDRADIGRKKVEVLSDKLKAINGNIKTYISYAVYTPDTNMDAFLDMSSFVVCTADEPYLGYTANLTSQLCVPRNINHYIAGGFDAHLASTGELVIPYVTPCAACYATYFEHKLKDWKPEKHPVVKRANEIGGLSSMSLFASSFACVEIIKCICGLVDIREKYKKRAEFLFDGMELVYLDPERNPNCIVCGGKEV